MSDKSLRNIMHVIVDAEYSLKEASKGEKKFLLYAFILYESSNIAIRNVLNSNTVRKSIHTVTGSEILVIEAEPFEFDIPDLQNDMDTLYKMYTTAKIKTNESGKIFLALSEISNQTIPKTLIIFSKRPHPLSNMEKEIKTLDTSSDVLAIPIYGKTEDDYKLTIQSILEHIGKALERMRSLNFDGSSELLLNFLFEELKKYKQGIMFRKVKDSLEQLSFLRGVTAIFGLFK